MIDGFPVRRRGRPAWVLAWGLAAGLAGGCRRAETEAARQAEAGTVRTAAVRRGELATRVLLSGRLEADSGIVVAVPKTPSWRVPIRRLAADGSRVAAGDLIVELDNSAFTSDLEEKRLQVLDRSHQLEERRLSLAIERERATFEREQRSTELEKARREARVPLELLGRQKLDQRRLAERKAELALAKAEGGLATKERAGEAELAQLELDLGRSRRDVESAEEAIRALAIRAPASGTVVIADHPWERRKLRVGDEIWVGAELLRLPDFARMTIHAELPDVDQGDLSAGQAVTCWLDAYPDQPFAARVVEVAPIAREEKGPSLRRFFAVRIAPEPGALDARKVRPGMSVKIEAGAPVRSGMRRLE